MWTVQIKNNNTTHVRDAAICFTDNGPGIDWQCETNTWCSSSSISCHYDRLWHGRKPEAQEEHGTEIDLAPGIAHVDKSARRRTWLPSPESSGEQRFRHQWIMKRRYSHCTPIYFGYNFPQPRNSDAHLFCVNSDERLSSLDSACSRFEHLCRIG